jgi:glycogen synthase
MLNVIHVTHASRSGAALYVYRLTSSLARTDTRILLVAPGDFEHRDKLAGTGIDLFPLRATVAAGRVAQVKGMLRQGADTALQLLRLRKSATLVHINFPLIVFLAAPLVALLRLFGYRIIFTVHDVLPHFWFLPGPFKIVERSCLGLTYRLCEQLIVHHADAVAELGREFGIGSERVAVIPHGEFCIGAPQPPLRGGSEVVAQVFGTLRQNKGIHLAIQACQQLRRDGVPVRLAIAGRPYKSEIAYWEQCKFLIAQAPDGISYLDHYIGDQEVQEIIAAAHLFLLPYSEFHSQSGVASLALSNGRPIAATRVGGLSEILIPGVTGIEIAAAGVAELKSALVEAVQLGQQGLLELGRLGREYYTEKYGWEAIARQYCELYQRLAGSKGKQKA